MNKSACLGVLTLEEVKCQCICFGMIEASGLQLY